MGDNTIPLQDSVSILGVEVDSRLLFDRHLEEVTRKASQKVTLLRRLSPLLNADGLLILYKEGSGQQAHHGVRATHMDGQCPLPPQPAGQSAEKNRA